MNRNRTRQPEFLTRSILSVLWVICLLGPRTLAADNADPAQQHRLLEQVLGGPLAWGSLPVCRTDVAELRIEELAVLGQGDDGFVCTDVVVWEHLLLFDQAGRLVYHHQREPGARHCDFRRFTYGSDGRLESVRLFQAASLSDGLGQRISQALDGSNAPPRKCYLFDEADDSWWDARSQMRRWQHRRNCTEPAQPVPRIRLGSWTAWVGEQGLLPLEHLLSAEALRSIAETGRQKPEALTAEMEEVDLQAGRPSWLQYRVWAEQGPYGTQATVVEYQASREMGPLENPAIRVNCERNSKGDWVFREDRELGGALRQAWRASYRYR